MARTIDPFETKRFCLQCSGAGLCPFSKRAGKNLGGGKHGISRGMVHGKGVPTMELKIKSLCSRRQTHENRSRVDFFRCRTESILKLKPYQLILRFPCNSLGIIQFGAATGRETHVDSAFLFQNASGQVPTVVFPMFAVWALSNTIESEWNASFFR